MEDVTLGSYNGTSKNKKPSRQDGYGSLLEDAPDQEENVCPLEHAGIYSTLMYSWMNPYVTKGFKRTLEEKDLGKLPTADRGEGLANEFERVYIQEKLNGHTHIGWTLWRMFGWKYLLQGLWSPVVFAANVAQVYILKTLVEMIEGRRADKPWTFGLYLCIAMGACALIQVFSNHQVFWGSGRIGLHARTAAATVLYRKVLQLHGSVLREVRIGQITNLITNDAGRLEMAFQFGHFGYWGLVQTLIVVGLLIWEVGWSALAGLAVVLIMFPLQGIFSKKIASIRTDTIRCTDERIRYINEFLQGIRVIKYFAWEPAFFQKITVSRRKEYEQLVRSAYVKAYNDAVFYAANGFMITVIYVLYIYLEGTLDATAAFTALALVLLIGRILWMIPRAISAYVEGKEGAKRISEFLLKQETAHHWDTVDQSSYQPPMSSLPMDDSQSRRPLDARLDRSSGQSSFSDSGDAVIVSGASFSWDEKQRFPTLSDLNFQIPKGRMLAVIGPVGSGKSSLLSALLGEMWKNKGTVQCNGSFAYVPQQAWVLNCTLRDNILFGRPYDEKKYQNILRSCALIDDLALLPAGDQTEIGEKGINLSGGQKQRISLARACYADADIVLLDDPLSAVDQNVGKILFDQCLCGLLQNKTRILVFNQVNYLDRPEIYKILKLEQGRMVEYGTYDFLLSTGKELLATEEKETKDEVKKPKKENKKKEDKGTLVEKEERKTGIVAWRIYKTYLRAGGGFWSWFMVAITFIICQAFNVGLSYWIAWWADDTFDKNPTNLERSTFYIYGLLILTSSQLIFAFFRAISITYATLRASSNLHNEMFLKVLRAPISFFDTTPLGRVLNRFSQDMDQVDQLLPFNLMNFLSCIFIVLGGLIAIVIIMPYFIISFIPLIIILIYYQTYAQRTSRQMKRLAGTTRSPVISQLASTLLGLDSVRAYNQQKRFYETYIKYTDENNCANLLFLGVNRWLGIRLDIMSALIVAATAGLVMALKDQMGAGLAGVAITQSLNIAGLFQYSVRQAAECENNMTSVERIITYDELPSEGNEEIEKEHAGQVHADGSWVQLDGRFSGWPATGTIEFKDAWMAYRMGLEPVLKGVNLRIEDGLRIGIAGRTGAGKSSILVALFRMAELSKGKIEIDGVDISQLPLHVLRGRLSIIPQDPVLFQGTIRSNLDPLDLYSDDAIWETLTRVSLRDNVERLAKKLQHEVDENGGNLSVGERQLLCLGRALLRNSKIIVMDEATANVDFKTDSMIQKTIRSEFKGATVLTIAHRINTIIDSDMVLVMHEGRVGEYDTPKNLLKNPDSIFAQLVKASEAEELEEAMPSSPSTVSLSRSPSQS